MSPRTDSYMSLCLEQASHSSLHYRHGAIIVRGGKVIGQGYNDYRPGFNGELKSGKMSNSASNSPAILALKQKRKSKQKSNQSEQGSKPGHGSMSSLASSDLGGGRLANSPLSMHSEMMAIQSALSLSSHSSSYASARSSTSMQKPETWKLPARGKRDLQLRNLKYYVEVVCAEAASASTGKQHGGKAHVQKLQFEAASPQLAPNGGAGLQCAAGGGEEEEEGNERGDKQVRGGSHSVQCCERSQGVSVWAPSGSSVSASCSPSRSRFHTKTTRTITCA